MGNTFKMGLCAWIALGGIAGCSGGVSSTSGGAGGSGSSGPTGSSTSTSTSSSSSSSGTTTGTSGSSTSGGTTSSGGSSCLSDCETNNSAEFLKFGINLLTDCGCDAMGTCAMQCSSYCANGKPSGAPPDPSPCRDCLTGEAMKKMGSACATKAGLACVQDPTCSKFVTCALGCP